MQGTVEVSDYVEGDKGSLCGIQTKPEPCEPCPFHCFHPEERNSEASSKSLLLQVKATWMLCLQNVNDLILNPNKSEIPVWILPQQLSLCPLLRTGYSGTWSLSLHVYWMEHLDCSANAQFQWLPSWICAADLSNTLSSVWKRKIWKCHKKVVFKSRKTFQHAKQCWHLTSF